MGTWPEASRRRRRPDNRSSTTARDTTSLTTKPSGYRCFSGGSH